MLNYIGNDAIAKAMQQKHDPTCSEDIFISTPQFVDAFLAACHRFAAEVGWLPRFRGRQLIYGRTELRVGNLTALKEIHSTVVILTLPRTRN